MHSASLPWPANVCINRGAAMSDRSLDFALQLRAALKPQALRTVNAGLAVAPGLLELLELAEFRVSKGQQVSKIANPSSSVDDQPDRLLLTYGQVADSLNVSLPTVKRLVASGKLPVKRMGRVRRVRVTDLVEFVARTD